MPTAGIDGIDGQDTTAGRGPAAAGTTNNIERAALLLLRVGEAGPDGITLRQLADALDAEKPAVHRALTALARHGFVEKVRHGWYRLGSSIYALARRESGTLDGIRRWRPAVITLAEEFGHCVYLVGRAGLDVVVLDMQLGRAPIQALTNGIGGRLPIGIGPGSIAIISAAERDEQDEVLSANAARIRQAGHDPEHIVRLVRESSRRGYAIDVGDFIADCGGISFPTREATGLADMAITIAAPSSYLSEERIAEITARMNELIHAT